MKQSDHRQNHIQLFAASLAHIGRDIRHELGSEEDGACVRVLANKLVAACEHVDLGGLEAHVRVRSNGQSHSTSLHTLLVNAFCCLFFIFPGYILI
jgi:hypothetical protein